MTVNEEGMKPPRDYAAYERSSYGWVGETPPPKNMTPAILGTLLVCAWRVVVPDTAWIPYQDLFCELINQANLPTCLQDVVHIEGRIGGPILVEFAEMANGAQSSGVLSRTSLEEGVVTVDALQAKLILGTYAVDFSNEVEWVSAFVKRRTGKD